MMNSTMKHDYNVFSNSDKISGCFFQMIAFDFMELMRFGDDVMNLQYLNDPINTLLFQIKNQILPGL